MGRRVFLALFLGITFVAVGYFGMGFGSGDGLADMVREQIGGRGITDPRLLRAFERVDRAHFVPLPLKPLAYLDRPLPIGHGQTISQPFIVALMTDFLKVGSTSRILEIGTGSGYQAAILAEMAPLGEVYTIEIVPELASASIKLFKELKIQNIFARAGDGFQGWPDKAPFDGIIVTCAPAKVPQPLKDQLAEGGRLVIPIGEQWEPQVLKVITRQGTEFIEEDRDWVRFVPMTGAARKESGSP